MRVVRDFRGSERRYKSWKLVGLGRCAKNSVEMAWMVWGSFPSPDMHRNTGLEKRAICKRVRVLQRVLRIQRSRGDSAEMAKMVASINATPEERQRRGAVIVADDPSGSGAGCPPPPAVHYRCCTKGGGLICEVPPSLHINWSCSSCC